MNERARPDARNHPLLPPASEAEPRAVAVSLAPTVGAGSDARPRAIEFEVDGRQVQVPDVGDTLLGVLRGSLGLTSVKDGCSPQGQCGCCTVLVDGQPRVSCVTPARRVAGRQVTTLDGLPPERAERWANRFCETGASQCGFCTPGIVLRLDALEQRNAAAGRLDEDRADVEAVRQALLAHLCRCTGWQTILEAWNHEGVPSTGRNFDAAAERAGIEGGWPQHVSASVALGAGGFAADTAPDDALIAVLDGHGHWIVGETLHAARSSAAKVQGRRTTVEHDWPVPIPDPGADPWLATMQTTWVEPGYLETDAAWCTPGGEPASPLANGGAFGAKHESVIGEVARSLADQYQRPILALFSREDSVRWGPKRPPVAAGIRTDGSGHITLACAPGIDAAVSAAIGAVAPGLTVEFVDVVGPPVSGQIRATGWAEAAVLQRAITEGPAEVTAPNGATATARLEPATQGGRPTISVRVRCGRVLDPVVLRSYCIGAAHMAWSWVTSEALTVDAEGEIHDLTIRSFGIVRAVDMPAVSVELLDDDGPPINGSDAVFAAVAAEVWAATGFSPQWPTGSDGMMST